MSTSHKKLQKAFVDGIGVPADTDFAALTYGAQGWDSVAHMQLIAQIERVFDVMLDTDQVIDMSSYAAAIAILESHDVAFES